MTTLLTSRSQLAAGLPRSDLGAGISATLPQHRDLMPGLRENERAVVRLFGTRALAEIREVGARCVGDGAFAAQVSALGSPDTSPEGWAKLASVMPDYLIAAHTMRAFLGGAVTPEYYRGLPNDGKSLTTLALSLQRFSNQAELQLAIQAERELSLVPNAEPIWSRLPLSLFTTYRAQQRAAYEKRLMIQPGGREILAGLQRETSFSKNLTVAITSTLVDKVSQLSVRDMQHIRALARDFHTKTWLPVSPEELARGPVRGLQASDGTIFTPPTELLERVSVLHHEAYTEARVLVAGIPDAPRSAAQAVRALGSIHSRELLKYNLDSIAALTWILEAGLVGDTVLAELNNSAPTPIVLKSGDGVVGSQEPIEETSEVAQVKEEPTLKPIVFVTGREIEHPELIRLVADLQHRITRDLFIRDLSDLQPLFTSIDHLPGDIRDPFFLKAMHQLRATHAYRMNYIESLTVGLLASDVETLARRGSEIVTSAAYSNEQVLDAIPDWQRREVKWRSLRLSEQKERLITDLGSKVGRLQPLTELLDPARTDPHLPAAKELLEAHVVDEYGTERYKRLGGIFGTYPFLTALEETFPGYVLVRRKATMDTNAFDGMFIYGRPGEYPSQIADLLTAIAPNRDLSFAGLFITAPDRAQGTYMSLLKGMTARLALEGGRYSLGIVGEENRKHHDLLLKLNHKPLQAASLYYKELSARYIPMLWELP